MEDLDEGEHEQHHKYDQQRDYYSSHLLTP
jgi:hypothetical protein